MVLVPDAPLKLVSLAYTKGKFRFTRLMERFPNDIFFSGAATTASRLGQPDLAIATLNDFVQVCRFE
jgi:hypothetical protein